ncbi:flagellum-specific ATP synthase FliI, partial [Pseudoxanthomonas sp. KAs_5_3]
LDKARGSVAHVTTTTASGRLTRAVGLVLEAVGLQLPVGSDCLIELPAGNAQRYAEAEVVGFAGDRLFLMSQTEVAGLVPGARVFAR